MTPDEIQKAGVPFDTIKSKAWRWRNFRPSEVACKGSGLVPTAPQFEHAMDCLQALRRAHGRPMFINSAYRCPEYNRFVGGAPKSQHPQGRAFDVSIANLDPYAFEELARLHGFNGIGRYKTFIHIDTRSRSAQWNASGWKQAWSKRAAA